MLNNITVNALLGLAIGDALGVPVEFYPRQNLSIEPLTDFREHGAHNVGLGEWSDDTSMTVATMDSIIRCKGINYEDIMQNFCKWAFLNEFSASGKSFGFGRTCLAAIGRYKRGGLAATECGGIKVNENGNGSLMRILPGVLYCCYKQLDENGTKIVIDNLSSLTHRHEISRLGCWIYTKFLLSIIRDQDVEKAYRKIQNSDYSVFSEESLLEYDRILRKDLRTLCEDDIRSSGYVVDSLEASLWSILNSKDFSSAVLKAINLGGDTDTIGAITGSIAGSLYEIPVHYIERIIRKEYLMALGIQFHTMLNN